MGPSGLAMALGCFALFGFAVAQPLFDLLGRNPTFLLEHEAGGRQVWLLIGASWLVPGLVCAGLLLILDRLWRPAALTLFAILTAILGAATVLPLIVRSLPAWLALSLGLAAGGLLAWWWLRRPSGELVMKLGALAPLIFTALFVFNPQIQSIVRPAESDGSARFQSSGSLRSFVLVILDEIPTTNLLREMNEIDAERFPNLARLRDDSIWFRNCYSVSGYTHRSIPAILTGQVVRDDRAPSLSNYPDNVFALVEEDMLLVGEETLTKLAPEVHKGDEPNARAHQLDLLFWDSGVLLLHRILPPDFAQRLPKVDSQWGGFGRAPTGSGHAGKFMQWVDRLQRGFKPTAGIIHVVYPHNPYVFYPSGARYTARGTEPFQIGGRWIDDGLAAEQSWVRARLQLEHADQLVGTMIERLEAIGLYDDAVIAITADHGASWRGGDFHRRLSDDNFADILPVPLFLKLPDGERGGSLDERLVATVDILPTVAEAAGFALPWATDGRSMLDVNQPGRDEAYFIDSDLEREVRFEPGQLQRQRETLDRMLELFDGVDATNPSLGPWRNLVGREVSELGSGPASPAVIQFDREGSPVYRGIVPGEPRGFLRTPESRDDPVHIAVAMGGRVVATTRTLQMDSSARTSEWIVLIPEHAFTASSGPAVFYEIESGAEPQLRLLRQRNETPSVVGRRLGITDLPGVQVQGLYSRLMGRDGRAALWTSAAAKILVTLRPDDVVGGLRLEILESSPTGTSLQVRIAGQLLFSGRIDPGPWSRTLALPSPLPAGPVEIEITAESFVPAELDPSSPDSRELGVLLGGIWLLAE